jgi:hypothetical protein
MGKRAPLFAMIARACFSFLASLLSRGKFYVGFGYGLERALKSNMWGFE